MHEAPLRKQLMLKLRFSNGRFGCFPAQTLYFWLIFKEVQKILKTSIHFFSPKWLAITCNLIKKLFIFEGFLLQ